MRKKVLIFNGPPQCGKDTACAAILAAMPNEDVVHLKFSQPLKDLVKSVGISSSDPDYRAYQISTFQALSKVFGADWLGRYMLRQLAMVDEDFVIISDGGRLDDVEATIRYHNVMIVQILRDGCNFGYDIRQYIAHPRAITRTIVNDDLESFKQKVVNLALQFFAE